MGSGQSTVAARTRSGGAKDDPIVVSSPSKSPPTRRQTREKAAEPVRIDRTSGRVRKLSPAPKQAAAPTAAQVLIAAAASAQQVVREPPKAILADPRRYGLRSHPHSPSPPPPNQGVPFALQMSLFGTTQKLIEETLFYWTKEWAPEVLQSKGWQVPEETELNYWFRSFDAQGRGYLKELVVRALVQSGSRLSYEDLRKLTGRLQHIRHAAVHRKRHEMPYIRALMADAIRITQCMDDPLRNKKIREMQKALIKNDMERLKTVIDMPIEDFNVAVAYLSGLVGKQVADDKAGQDPVSRKHDDLHSRVGRVEAKLSRSEGIRDWGGEIANHLPTGPGATFGKENRDEKLGLSHGMTLPQVLPSTEREFGMRRENMSLTSSNIQGRTRSSTKNSTKAAIVDLTEDGDDDVFEDAREQQPISKKRVQENSPEVSNKRTCDYVGRSFIEISDTDSGKESGEIDEEGESDDDDDEAMYFSNAPRRRPYAQYKKPRLGKDY